LPSSTFGHNYPILQCGLSVIAELLVSASVGQITTLAEFSRTIQPSLAIF